MHAMRLYLLALLLTIFAGACFAQTTGNNAGGLGSLPVIVVSPTSNQCLVFNGTNWTNQSCAGGGGTVDMANVVQTGGETWPLAYLQSTQVTNNTTTYAFGSGDNGNLIAEQTHSGGCNATLPQIGTAGLIGNAWQAAYANYGTITCALTPGTSTINSGAVVYIPQNAFGLLFPDANSPGNYNALIGGGYSFASNGTATWPNDLKVPLYIANGSGGTGISGQAWFGQQTSGGPCLGYGSTSCALWVNTTAINSDFSGLPVAKGAVPTLTCTTSSATCTQSSTAGIASTFPGSGSSITATGVNFVPNEPVQITSTGTIPGGYSASTTYYVNVTGIATTGFQLCATAMPLPTTWTAGASSWTPCTSVSGSSAGTGTITVTPLGSSNYIAYGGAQRGFFQLPVGTYTAAAYFKLTWPSDSDITIGIQCQGYDWTQNTQMVMPSMSTTSSTLEKATAATALDFITYSCGAV